MRDEGTARFWEEMERPGPESVIVAGVELRRGSRVRLRPRPGGDIMDIVLAGRTATIEGIDQDENGAVHVAVAIDDDPGRDLGMDRAPAHRFFFRAEEVEPLQKTPRILVAGIGNIFMGDDGFGCAVAQRFARRDLPDGVSVRDFGIRGMDLAYEFARFDIVIMIDAVPRGGPAGALYIIDAATDATGPAAIDTHGMDPVKVMALARALGPLPERVLVVGCEPERVPPPDSDEIVGELSEPVHSAVDAALELLGSLLAQLAAETRPDAPDGTDGASVPD